MDYKKAYEDALERAKGIYNENPSSSTAKFVCGQIFPELKESEDERMRKTLLRCCDDWEKGQFGCMAKEDVPAIRAYLEKQKAQRPAEWSDAERKKLYCDGYDSSRKNLALDFMHYIDEHRPEGKMCLSNGECAALMNAFKVGDVETIVRYINKYQQPAECLRPEKDCWYVCIKDFYGGGKKQNSKGDLVQAKGGMYMMGRDDISEWFRKAYYDEIKPAEWSEAKFPKDIEKDATQFCFDKGINITPHQAKEIATHYLMIGHNNGYIEGRKNAHIPAKELGLPSSMDFKQEWSEEEKETLEKLHRLLVICRGEKKFIQEADYNKMDNLLKSLRPSWKPSEEHFQGLRRAITKAEKGSDAWNSLTDLYEHLKKL